MNLVFICSSAYTTPNLYFKKTSFDLIYSFAIIFCLAENSAESLAFIYLVLLPFVYNRQHLFDYLAYEKL